MKKIVYLIVLALILGLVLTGCLLSNVGQVPTSEQSGITYLTKNGMLTGLVGLWHFDGDALDSSGNANDGEVYGASWVDGKFGKALSFDGSGYYVDFGIGVTGLITGDYTVEAWIKPATLDSGRHAVMSFSYMELGHNAGKVYFWQAYDNSWGKGYQYMSPTALLDVTKFSHIVGVFHKDTGVDLYVDGNYIGSDTTKTGTTLLNIFGKTYAGVWYQMPPFGPGGAYFNGTIDEVRIYDYALSSGTIADHAEGIYGFNGLLAPYAPPDQKAFKLGSTIPLKWQYTDSSGEVFDSIDANPEVKCQFAGGGNGDGDLISPEDPGSSGLRYNSDTKTWQFNWQTKGLITGIGEYNIWIASKLTGQVNGPFLIELR